MPFKTSSAVGASAGYLALALVVSSIGSCSAPPSLGTSSAPPSLGGSAPAPKLLSVMTEAGDFEGYFPAQLSAYLGSKHKRYVLTVTATRPGELWATQAVLSAEQARGGNVDLAVQDGATPEGRASVQRTRGFGQAEYARSGRLEAVFGKAGISGTVTEAFPTTMNATFSGRFFVECSVPRAALQAAGAKVQPGGITSDDGSEALESDDALITPDCLPLRALAR